MCASRKERDQQSSCPTRGSAFTLACLMLLVLNTQGKPQMVKSSFKVENKALPVGSPKEQALLQSPPQGFSPRSETQLLAQATSVIHNSVKPASSWEMFLRPASCTIITTSY